MATSSTQLSGYIAGTMATAAAAATSTASERNVAGADVTRAQESSVIKRIAAIILKAGNGELAQKKSAEEIRKIILGNPGINLNRPIDDETVNNIPPTASTLTLTDLAIFINNIAATATLASLGATLRTSHPDDNFMQVLELEERLHAVRIRMKKIAIAEKKAKPAVAIVSKTTASSAGAPAAVAEQTNLKNTSELEKICTLLEAANTDDENKMAALTIDGILKGAVVKPDLNKALPDGRYLINIALAKKNNKATIVLRIFGAEYPLKWQKLAAKSPDIRKLLTEIDKVVTAERQEVGKAQDATHSTKMQSKADIKSLDEEEKKTRIDLMNKFKMKCKTLLELNKKYIGEWRAIYEGYDHDPSVAIINSPELLQQNITILGDVARNSILHFFVILQNFSQEKYSDGILSIREVHSYYRSLSEYQTKTDMTNQKINLLPAFLRKKIRDIVDKNNKIATHFFQAFGKVLAVCSGGYSKRYRSLVDESLYGSVWSLEADGKVDYVKINQRYLAILQAAMKKKMEVLDSLFDPLKPLKIFYSFNTYKKYYLDQVDRRFKTIMAFTQGGDLATPQQFIKYSEADMDIKHYYTQYIIIINNIVQKMVLLNKDKLISKEALKTPLVKQEASGPLVTRDEIEQQDRRIAKMREAARRQKAQADAVLQENIDTKRLEKTLSEAKVQGEKAKVRAEIISGMQKLTKDEALLLEKILQNNNPQSSQDVALIKGILPKLNLNPRDTQSSAGGQATTINKTKIGFHPKHSGRKKTKGRLDSGFIADFRKALNEVGVTLADLLQAREVPANAVGHGSAAIGSNAVPSIVPATAAAMDTNSTAGTATAKVSVKK